MSLSIEVDIRLLDLVVIALAIALIIAWRWMVNRKRRRRGQLNIALIWDGEVMADAVADLAHLTIGTTSASSVVTPDLGLPETYELFRRVGPGWRINLLPSMSGTVSVNGTERNVTELGASASVSCKDWGVIDLDATGQWQIFYRVVPLPPRVPLMIFDSMQILLPALALSIILHVVFLVVSYQLDTGESPFVWPGSRALTGNYLVTHIDKPPEPPPTPTAAAPAAAMTAAPTTGQVKHVNSATKGPSGKSGGEGDLPRAHDPNAKDVPPEPPKVALFEDTNRKYIDNIVQTNLATSLGKFTGLAGPQQRGAIGSGTGHGSGVGVGTGTGTTRGGKGKGNGGGGAVEGDLVSSGKIDTGETRTAKGSGGTGTGVKEVQVGFAGGAGGDFSGLTKDDIDRVVRARQGLIKACYQKELNHTAGLGGKLVLTFVIGADGGVTSTRVDPGKSSLRNDAVESCIRTQISKLKFPAKGGGVVNYPFIFSQGT